MEVNERSMRIERERVERTERRVSSYPATQAARRSMVCICVVSENGKGGEKGNE